MNGFIDDSLAFDYVRERGYVSYSSMKMIRDGEVPGAFKGSAATDFGKELHSRLLENKVLQKFSTVIELQLSDMLVALRYNVVVQQLLKNAKKEQEFKTMVNGIMMLGYYDILNTTNVSDLKTTSTGNMKAFVSSMDFLQAAIYLKASGCKDFYYIGACKVSPYPVWVFNVWEYPQRMAKAQSELARLCMYIKSKP